MYLTYPSSAERPQNPHCYYGPHIRLQYVDCIAINHRQMTLHRQPEKMPGSEHTIFKSSRKTVELSISMKFGTRKTNVSRLNIYSLTRILIFGQSVSSNKTVR